MSNTVSSYKNNHKKGNKRRVFLTVLASIVVFLTTYALIIPAVTMNATLICKIPEHTHGPSCYTVSADGKTVLTCTKTEHTHTPECYDAPAYSGVKRYCGKDEHTHTAECYYEDGVTLKCTIPVHTHDSSCLVSGYHAKTLKRLADGEADEVTKKADPDTSDIDALFRVNGEYTPAYNGKVAADKTVTDAGENKFNVLLSALSQTYQTSEATEERLHPDVVFVVDGSTSMYNYDMNGSPERRMMGVVKSLNSAIDKLLESDSETRIGIVLFGTDYYPTKLYLPLDKYARLPNAEYITYGKVINTNGSISYSATKRQELKVTNTYGFIRINGTGTWASANTSSSSPSAQYSSNNRFRITRATGLVEYYKANSSTATSSVIIPDGSFAVLDQTEYIVYREGDTYTVTDHGNGDRTVAISGLLQRAAPQSGNPGTKQYTSTSEGTYTQAGILAGKDMLVNATDKEKRIPVEILISDGAPTYYKTDFKALSGSKQGTGSASNSTTAMGYYTIRSAMYAKQQIKDAYADYNSGSEAMFFSIGPGVDYLYGQTVLSPGTHNPADDPQSNLEKCEGDTSKNDQTGSATPDALYKMLTDGIADGSIGEEELDYVNFADWSIAGNLTAEALDEGMTTIVEKIKRVPRPASTVTVTQHESLDTASKITFTDVIGDGMVINGAPTLYYNNVAHPASGSTVSGKFTSGEYAGCSYTLYKFSGVTEEPSTGETARLSDAEVYVIDKDGKKIVAWQFSANLLPVINYYADTDTFKSAPPIRLSFEVEPAGILAPGKTYYSNSTSDVANMTFHESSSNPYPFTDGEIDKTENITETLDYSSNVLKNDRTVTIKLGNNGSLTTPPQFYITKVWTDDNPGNVSSIVVHLYADGVNTGRSVTLTAEDGWMSKFDNIEKYAADGHEIIYTVKEDAPQGYQVSGETVIVDDIPITTDITVPKTTHVKTAWEALPESGFDADDTYRIIYTSGTTTYALSGSNSSVSRATASSGTSEFTNKNQQWKVVDGNKLKNVATGTYIKLNYSRSTYSFGLSSSGSTFTTSDNSHLYFRYDNSNSRYLRLNSSISPATNTTNADSALVFQRLVPEHDVTEYVTETITTDVLGFRLSNSPIPVDVPIEKVWTDRVPTDDREAITVSVYEKTSSGYSLFTTVDLSSANDWKSVIEDLLYTKTYYAVENTTEGYFYPVYAGGDSEAITIGSTTVKAVKINPGTVEKITVTNDIDQRTPKHTKTIDALREGDNTDTDVDNGTADLTDLYRLYLTAGPETFALDSFDSYVDLNVTDTLSENVDFYNTDLDLVIKKTDADGNNPVVLYENNTVTNAGKDYLANGCVTFPDNKTISVDFNNTSSIPFVFSVSFNVKATEKAYKKYIAHIKANGIGNGYGNEAGDPLTDYGTNATSSSKPGFKSNDSASFSYKIGTRTYDLPYDDPVIQVGTENVTVRKIWSDGNNNHIGEPVTAALYINGDKLAECVLSADNSWEYTFRDLPKDQEYTVKEESSFTGYVVRYTEASDGAYVINNIKEVFVDIEKKWHGVKDDSATFFLYAVKDGDAYPLLDADGKQYTITLDEDCDWKGTISGIPEPSVGEEYFLVEQAIDGAAAIYSNLEHITVNNINIAAEKLVFGDDNTASVTVINITTETLPYTGGTVGGDKLKRIGISLLFSVLVGAWIFVRRKDKRIAES